MRTLATQVKLRRLIRTSGEVWTRLAGDPFERGRVGSVVDRLHGLSAAVRDSWRWESLASPTSPVDATAALERYVSESLRSIELAISGLEQAGADLELLRDDFEAAALPLEVFLRGLDAEPALQRSA